MGSNIEDQKLLNRMELSNRSPGCNELPEGDRAMNPPDEFLKHAADCEQMASFFFFIPAASS
jgi:hypothetical protein